VAGSPDGFSIVVGEVHEHAETLIGSLIARQEKADKAAGRPAPRPDYIRDADIAMSFAREWATWRPSRQHAAERGVMVVAFDAHGDPAGYVTAWAGREIPHCEDAYEALCRESRRDLRVASVVRSYVRTAYRGTGLGVALYVAAARAVAPESVLCAETCESGGTTTTAARRVWASRAFAEQVRVVGLVAWGGNDPRGALAGDAPAPGDGTFGAMNDSDRPVMPAPEAWVRYRQDGQSRKFWAPVPREAAYHLSPATVVRRDGWTVCVVDREGLVVYFLSAADGRRKSPKDALRGVDLFSTELDAWRAAEADYARPIARKPNPSLNLMPKAPKKGPARSNRLRHAALGQALASFVASDAFYRAITAARPEDPVARGAKRALGSRFLLAEALAIWAGPAAELMAVRRTTEHNDTSIVSVLCCIEGWCFDDEGDRDGSDADPKGRGGRGALWVAPLERSDLDHDELGARSDRRGLVLRALSEALGRPDEWGISPTGDSEPWSRVRVRVEGDPPARGAIERAREALASAPGVTHVESNHRYASAMMPESSKRSAVAKARRVKGVEEVTSEQVVRAVPGAALGATLWSLRDVASRGFGPFDRS